MILLWRSYEAYLQGAQGENRSRLGSALHRCTAIPFLVGELGLGVRLHCKESSASVERNEVHFTLEAYKSIRARNGYISLSVGSAERGIAYWRCILHALSMITET